MANKSLSLVKVIRTGTYGNWLSVKNCSPLESSRNYYTRETDEEDSTKRGHIKSYRPPVVGRLIGSKNLSRLQYMKLMADDKIHPRTEAILPNLEKKDEKQK